MDCGPGSDLLLKIAICGIQLDLSSKRLLLSKLDTRLLVPKICINVGMAVAIPVISFVCIAVLQGSNANASIAVSDLASAWY